MTPAPPQYPIIDGFGFSTKQRCNLRFQALAIQQYEALRRASAFRNKTWCVPQDSAILIPARDSYERQVWVPAGSAIWGFNFSGNTAPYEQDDVLQLGGQSFAIFDNCDDLPLLSEIVSRRNKANNWEQVQYLSKLLVIGPPGLLNVIIANTFATDQVGQLVLYGGEPVNAYA